jgi:hypothetical protein
LVATTLGEGLALRADTRTRSSTLCTAVEWVSSRRTFSGRASIVAVANIASNEGADRERADQRGPPGWTQLISSSSDHRPISRLDVAALQRLVELDLHVVGRAGLRGRWLRSAHRALRLLSSAGL